MSRSTLRGLALCGVLAATAGGIALATEGGDDRSGGRQDRGPLVSDTTPDLRQGTRARFADCRDWRAAGAAGRRELIRDIRRQVNLQDTPTPTNPLPDRQAGQVFDRVCRPGYAAAFRLYIVYARAVAFQSLGD